MVADLGTKALGPDEAYIPTITSNHPGPITRSVFVIRKVEKADMFGSDDIIRYGQKVRIEVNPYLHRKPLSLSSQHLSPTVYSPVSGKQEASLTTRDVAFNNTWIIDHIDPNYRFEKQGSPVEASDPVLIRHLATNHYLASDLNKIKNEFGTEFEVFVHSFASKNRSQNLALEKDGKITGDLPTKFQDDQNIFFLLTAPGPQYSQPIEELNKFTIEDLVKEIKAKIMERSAAGGLRGMIRIFKAMDNNKNGLLDVDDFRWGLMDYGVSISKDEAVQVLKHFDRDGNGQVDFNEFVRTLRGELKPSRRDIIRAAYNKLDVNKDGQVRLDDIAKLYDASKHQDVIYGKKTEEQVLIEFMGMWDTQQRDHVVTFEEFCDYYSDISASIDDDDYFNGVIRSAWKL